MNQVAIDIFKIDIWAVAKVFVLMAMAIYVFFAFVVVRQVKLMTRVVSGILSGFLNLIAWLFFLFSISVFILILLFL